MYPAKCDWWIACLVVLASLVEHAVRHVALEMPPGQGRRESPHPNEAKIPIPLTTNTRTGLLPCHHPQSDAMNAVALHAMAVNRQIAASMASVSLDQLAVPPTCHTPSDRKAMTPRSRPTARKTSVSTNATRATRFEACCMAIP
jgi:hypothetical protein